MISSMNEENVYEKMILREKLEMQMKQYEGEITILPSIRVEIPRYNREVKGLRSKIKEVLKNSNEPINGVADRIGVGYSLLRRIINDEVKVKESSIKKVAKLLRVK